MGLLLFSGYGCAGEKGLVGYWTFDEGEGLVAEDDSGNENNGEIFGAFHVKGINGYALKFVAGGVVVPNSRLLSGMKELTITLWVRAENVTRANNAGLLVKDYARGSYIIKLKFSGIQPAFFQFQRAGSGGYASVNWETPVQIEKWYYLAVVSDGNRIKLYLNGEPDAEPVFFKGDILKSDSPLWIAGNGNGVGFFSGIIDEVNIYNRALSEKEIKEAFLSCHYSENNRK